MSEKGEPDGYTLSHSFYKLYHNFHHTRHNKQQDVPYKQQGIFTDLIAYLFLPVLRGRVIFGGIFQWQAIWQYTVQANTKYVFAHTRQTHSKGNTTQSHGWLPAFQRIIQLLGEHEDENSRFLYSNGNHLQDYTLFQHRRPQSKFHNHENHNYISDQ